MISAREVASLAAAVLCPFVRKISTVVLSVAESVARDAAVVTRTAPKPRLTRMLLAILPCSVDEKPRLRLTAVAKNGSL